MALLRAGDARALLTRHADLALAALVVSIVAMMLIPLPTFLLDLLLSLNIAIAVTLLLISIYVGDVLKIATFPTLLLLTTLFRLALEISATRLILTHANAGEVIRAFGGFVVAGNLVVGAVIFLILTIIQFVVISKGAERVAEVAARFTLDAMPGKQMSIDAELRAGHIDHQESRRRRALLARESQLFGAMDGAMKFVKGDAIAGLVVLAVNVLGGLIIGVWQRGMDLADAARTFTVLTIGEGLVAQIPALVISTAAGIIVTRVASEEEGAHLGKEMAGQILGQPKAIAIAAVLLALLALVPGLPFVPFVALAALLGLVARALLTKKSSQASQTRADATDGDGAWARAGRDSGPAPLLTAIAIELGPDASAQLCPDGDTDACAARLTIALAPPLFAELGIPLPALRVRANAPDVTSSGYVIRFNEVPLGRGDLAPDGDTEQTLGAHVMTLLRRYGHEFVGIEETQLLLDRLAETHPALVREVVPKVISPTLLADVLRRLVEEGVSLRNLKDVLGALAEWAPQQKDPVTLTEHVRAALRRAITYQHANGDGVLPVFLLDPMIEDVVREAIHKTATGSYLALEPQLSRDIVDAVGRAMTSVPAQGAPAVILTNADIRRYVRRLVETEHPLLAVLAYPELAPEARVQTLGHIRVGFASASG
ncbi:MAG TPA: flagellar biosynthesis protein FlhA [Polyangia bacterium]